MKPGDEMMIWSEGGRSAIRLETFPLELKIVERGGTHVLHDEGDPADWRYVFVADGER